MIYSLLYNRIYWGIDRSSFYWRRYLSYDNSIVFTSHRASW